MKNGGIGRAADAAALSTAFTGAEEPRAEDEIVQLRRRAEVAETLAGTLSEVGAAATLESAIEALLRGAIRLLRAEHGVARVFNPKTRQPLYSLSVVQDGALRSAQNPRAPLPGTFTQAIQDGGDPILIEDFQALDPASYPLYESLKARGLRSAIHVGIDADGQRIGSFSVEHTTPGFFGPAEVTVANALASQAGGAIARAWMATEVDTMKNEFISLVSHELRTPLTSIKGYTDLLIAGEMGQVTEEQTEFLGIIKNNADRLVSLINDLLDVSRIEAGKIELDLTPLDLGELTRDVVRSFRPQIEGKRQRLTLSAEDGLPRVDGDCNRLTQVLTNLISNAHKYTQAGGEIDVLVGKEGLGLQVQVSDNGVGMSEDELQHLFEKFFRAHNRATQESGGTGLGLVIARQIVEKHGGKIWVESAPGKGTTFGIVLPIP
jgi:signal transduction histidine kinase